MKKLYREPLLRYFERRLAAVAPEFVAIKLPKEHLYQFCPTFVRKLDDRHWLFAALRPDPRSARESFSFEIGWSDKASVPENEGGPGRSVENVPKYIRQYGQQRLNISPYRGEWDFEPSFNKLPHQFEPHPLSKERVEQVVKAMASKAFDLFVEQALPVFAEYEAGWRAGTLPSSSEQENQ